MAKNTTFNDLFEDALENMPQLFISLVDEAFDTELSFDVSFQVLAQRQLSTSTVTVTAAFVQIGNGYYQIECQSVANQEIYIRITHMYSLLSFDGFFLDDGVYSAKVPETGIFYLTGKQEKFPQVMVVAPNGEALLCDAKTINIQDYSFEDITGLYFYPGGVAEMAEKVKPSNRGELEITTLNEMYLKEEKLKVQILGRGFAWLDTGTMDSLMEASVFIQNVQNRQDVVISAPEEVAYHESWISKEELLKSAEMYGKSPYGEHLRRVAEDRLLF